MDGKAKDFFRGGHEYFFFVLTQKKKNRTSSKNFVLVQKKLYQR